MGKRRKHTILTKGNTNAYYIYEKIFNFSHMREIQIEVIPRHFFSFIKQAKIQIFDNTASKAVGGNALNTVVKRLNRQNPI